MGNDYSLITEFQAVVRNSQPSVGYDEGRRRSSRVHRTIVENHGSAHNQGGPTREDPLFLVIVGDGPHRVTLEEQAKALRVEERVRFVGSVPNPEMANYYQAADAFLFPTLRREGLPFVLLEAMASGLPVIASQIGGIPEALGDAGCGFLLPPGDIKALEARMLQFLEDPRSAKQMGEAAWERVKRLYEKAEILARIEEVCRELVGTRSGWRR